MQGKAAFADSKGAHLTVRDAPNWQVEDDEVKIKVHALAINPADYKILDTGMYVQTWPVIFGIDCAGEIVETGSKAKNFAVGNRVAAMPGGIFNPRGNKCGGFQEYAVAQEERVFKIPDDWKFEDATVFPLAICTAAVSLYSKDRLALAYPQVEKPASNGKILLVWGGSSSVGACAVQMAAHSGYEVFATASKRNFDFVKSIGASQVFDYTEKSVLNDIATAIKGREEDFIGAYSATQEGDGIPQAAYVAEAAGLTNMFVATANPRFPQEGWPKGVKIAPNIATQCFGPVGPGLPAELEVGEKVFKTWLPAALAANTIKVSPPAKVVGHGLESVDSAVDLSRQGKVSGEKLVVLL